MSLWRYIKTNITIRSERVSDYNQIANINAALEKSNSFKVVDKSNNHKAFMIKILDEKSSIATYCLKVEKNIIKPGIIIFPAIFDVDDGRTE